MVIKHSMEKYKDIINIPYQKSKNRKQMTLAERASQFMPFSALAGYEASLEEVKRLTDKRIELSQENKDIISAKLNYISLNKLVEEVTIVYFVKDERKQGGMYKTINSSIKRIDEVRRKIVFLDKEELDINEVIDITSPTLDRVFNYYEII